jgi:hypothetical protein
MSLATAIPSWIAFGIGCVVLVTTWGSVIGTLILPRWLHSWVSSITALVTRRAIGLVIVGVSSYPLRDRILAWQAPLAIFTRLITWVILFYVSFTLMLVPSVGGSPAKAFDEAGSAMFTLGYAIPTRIDSSFIVYAAAFTGLVVIALQIGYLPTLYAAFNRRESEVTLLVSRAGSPAWGPELLARTRFGLSTVDGVSELSTLYVNWERWAAEVAESHSTYLTLCWMRSPGAYANWLISLLCVMDAAAMQLSLNPSTAPALRARLCLRMGFTCLNQIGRALRLPVDDDVDPDTPIELTFDEFAKAVQVLESVGYPLETSAEQAWPHFRGWRSNYERVAYAIAHEIDAPPALWSGTRRFRSEPVPPSRPTNRVSSDAKPDDPQLSRRNQN